MVHEPRSHHFRATGRAPSPQGIPEVCCPLSWRLQPTRLYLLGPISDPVFAQLTYRESLRDIEACRKRMVWAVLVGGGVSMNGVGI